MKTLKITVADEDGIVLGQYTVRDERELDGMDDEETDRAYDDPKVIYLDLNRRNEGMFQGDLRVFLNRVNGD